jgi:hypothetical protein
MKHAKWISGLVLLAMPLVAAAQKPTERMATQVPFKFMVGAVEMPAGEYIVQLTDAKGAAVLTVGNPEARRSVFVLPVANLGKKSETGAMVFHRYGDHYFLTELRLEDSRTIYTLQSTKLEKEFRAQNIPASEDILLASRP